MSFLNLRSRRTLIYIGRERLVRCDIDARTGEVLGFWNRTRPLGPELPALVDTALALGARKAKYVWVLATDFFAQKLTMATEAVEGLAPAEVGRAIAFEAESLSGLAAFESDVGYVARNIDRHFREFWLIQVSHSTRDAIEAVVRAQGGKLIGLAHPAGLPRPLGRNLGPAISWMRVEAWPGFLIGLALSNDGKWHHFLANTDRQNADAQAGLQDWVNSVGPVETTEQLADEGVSLPFAVGATSWSLDDEGRLKSWLAEWSETLGMPEFPVPSVHPPQRPMSAQLRAAISAGIAVNVGTIVLVDYWHTDRTITDGNAELKSLRAIDTALADAKKKTTATEQEIKRNRAALEKSQAEIASAMAGLSAQRIRRVQLLKSLAEHCPPGLTVREISDGRSSLVIRGASLHPFDADIFATVLALQLRPYGWHVSPAHKNVRNVALENQVCDFELTLYEGSPINNPGDDGHP